MDIEKLRGLSSTNYFHVVATLLGGFQKIDRANYEQLLDNQGYDTLIKSETAREVALQFKHDERDYCDASLDFAPTGELENVRLLILPIGHFAKRRAKSYLKTLLNLLQGIAKHQDSHIETIKKKRQYRLVSNGLMITLNLDKNESSQAYVSIWCEYLPE